MGIVDSPDAKCSLCGSTASACWIGQKTILICRDCALKQLPRLIADATVGKVDATDVVGAAHRDLETIEKNFWMACTAMQGRPWKERVYSGAMQEVKNAHRARK